MQNNLDVKGKVNITWKTGNLRDSCRDENLVAAMYLKTASRSDLAGAFEVSIRRNDVTMMKFLCRNEKLRHI